jgi:hypothetical protein
MLTFAVAVTTCLLVGWSARAQETTGDLLTYCEAYQRGAKEKGGQLLLPNVPAAICLGYFNAIHHLAYAQMSPTEQEGMLRLICLPNHGPDVFELIRVFMAYARAHS